MVSYSFAYCNGHQLVSDFSVTSENATIFSLDGE